MSLSDVSFQENTMAGPQFALPALNSSSRVESHRSNPSALSMADPILTPIAILGQEMQAELRTQSQRGPGGRELHSKEQWEAIKPFIRLLYVIGNKPYKRVVEILRTYHDFILTYELNLINSKL